MGDIIRRLFRSVVGQKRRRLLVLLNILNVKNTIIFVPDRFLDSSHILLRLELISDYFRTRADKYEVLGTLPQSQRTFVMSGYVPKKYVAAVEKAIGSFSGMNQSAGTVTIFPKNVPDTMSTTFPK